MAFAILNLKHRQNENIKKAPVGFSWTVFFFGCFPAVFRGDWKWFLIMAILQMVTFNLSTFVMMFIYNKIYLNSIIEQGYAAGEAIVAMATVKIGRDLTNWGEDYYIRPKYTLKSGEKVLATAYFRKLKASSEKLNLNIKLGKNTLTF